MFLDLQRSKALFEKVKNLFHKFEHGGLIEKNLRAEFRRFHQFIDLEELIVKEKNVSQ